MAVYGVNVASGVANNGAIPFTGWTPTLGAGSATAGSSAGSVWFNGQTQDDYILMSRFTRMSARGFLAILKGVTGGAAGVAMSTNYKRVAAVQGGQMGGLIQVETQPVVGRTTTAADIAAINGLWNRVVNPTTYPADVGGSGGGGKLSFIGVV